MSRCYVVENFFRGDLSQSKHESVSSSQPLNATHLSLFPVWADKRQTSRPATSLSDDSSSHYFGINLHVRSHPKIDGRIKNHAFGSAADELS